MFTSVPFLLGVGLLAIAVVIGVVIETPDRSRRRARQPDGRSVGRRATARLFRVPSRRCAGTIINNLWWVVTVTFFSTALGLAIAVLADQRGGEKIAKSIIFMPMALSLVGASIIWRFVYTARDVSQGADRCDERRLGRARTTLDGFGPADADRHDLPGIVLAVVSTFLARSLARRARTGGRARRRCSSSVGSSSATPRSSVGASADSSYTDDEDGPAETIVFVQETPYNNFWLMVILIWIQVGFSMVILSAAIKAVPTELIEAAKIDGATDSQVFWRVTLPQIATTIGVVVTTLIVLVMKVFDIVKVVTNGQFDTQVLANDMYQQAFNNINIGPRRRTGDAHLPVGPAGHVLQHPQNAEGGLT